MKGIMIIVAALAATLTARAASEEGMTYRFDSDGTCTLLKADCAGDVVLPATVEHENRQYVLTTIGVGAFADSRVVTLSLPETIAEIGEDAFRRCIALEKVTVPTLEAWTRISFANEYASPLNGMRPLYIGDSPLTALEIPEGVPELKPYAFYDCSSLVTADLHGVSSVPPHCFDGCEGLRGIALDPGTTAVGEWAFSICTSLGEIRLPDSVAEVGQGAFYGCSSLKNVELPAALAYIPALGFAGCVSLEHLDFLPSSIQGVGDYAFYFCTGLERASFPEATKYFGQFLFRDCESLREVKIPAEDAQLDEFMFANCYRLESVGLPQEIEALPQGLFFECQSLKDVVLPLSVREIGPYAFGDCHSLPFLALPDGLLHIGECALYGCYALTRVDFPPSMESIAAEAFYQCPRLDQIHVRSAVPFNISFFSFDWRADREAHVFVPAASLQLYLDDKYGWGSFDNIEGLEEYNADTWLSVSWGGTEVGRPVEYGAEIQLCVLREDGSLPAKVTFNGAELAVSPDGYVTTPPVTGKSLLAVE